MRTKYYTPKKSNIDINDLPFVKGVTFSNHAFGYPSVYIPEAMSICRSQQGGNGFCCVGVGAAHDGGTVLDPTSEKLSCCTQVVWFQMFFVCLVGETWWSIRIYDSSIIVYIWAAIQKYIIYIYIHRKVENNTWLWVKYISTQWSPLCNLWL